jgi:AcrR family transcriptional regulator
LRRTDMSPEERRRHVVDCARDLFIEQGYSATSTAMIAKAADISEMTLFRYFTHKRDLFLAVIHPVLAVFEPDTVFPTEYSHPSGETMLWSFIQRKLEFIRENQGLVLLVLIESKLQPDLAGDINPMHQVQSQLTTMLVALGLSSEDTSVVIREIIGLFTSTLFSPKNTYVDEQVAKVVFEDVKRRIQSRSQES